MFVFKFPFGPLQTNGLLVGCSKTKKAAVVDAPLGSAGAILQKAKEEGLTIEKILFTHSHWDHIADAQELETATKVPLYIHPLDAKNLEKPGSDGIPLYFPIAPAKTDHFLNEGDLLSIGHLKLEVIHTPGHSPGSVCFYFPLEHLLISGDTLFRGTIGTLNLPTAEPEEMWKSLNKLAKLPLDTRVIPGHGGETSIGKESWLPKAKELFSE